MKSSQGITVLEALIVLVVLFILAALLFPAVSIGPESPPRRALAKNDVTQIATAVTAFETEYGHLPGTNTGTVGGDVLAALMGSNDLANPRKLVFLEVPAAKKARSGLTNGTYVDPWGGAYQIAFATGSNNWVMGGTNGVKVWKRVAVWSDPNLGSDASSLSDAKKLRHYVTSWD